MLIGVVGQLDSGKGTIGSYLIEKHGFVAESFAKPVKDCTAAIFGWPRHLLEGDTKESREFREANDYEWTTKLGFPVTPRWAMQRVGTEAGRNGLHNDIWIHALDYRITTHYYTKNFVITDVRFPNEMAFITKKGGHLIEASRGQGKNWEHYARELRRVMDLGSYSHIKTYENVQNLMKANWNIHESEWAYIFGNVDYKIKNDGSLADLYDAVENTLSEIEELTNMLTSKKGE